MENTDQDDQPMIGLAYSQELRGMTFNRHKEHSKRIEMLCIFDCGDDYMGVYLVEIHLTVYFKLVHFILCRLCINQLSLKMEKVVGAVSKGLERENNSFFHPGNPKRKRDPAYTIQLLEIFENETEEIFDFLIIKKLYLDAWRFGNLL